MKEVTDIQCKYTYSSGKCQSHRCQIFGHFVWFWHL